MRRMTPRHAKRRATSKVRTPVWITTIRRRACSRAVTIPRTIRACIATPIRTIPSCGGERVSEDDEIDRSVVQHGWHAIGVDDHEPPFLYTIGLISQFQHPELVILGLEGKTAHPLVARSVEMIRNGTRL